MRTKNEITNDEIEALRRKEQAVKSALAAALVKAQQAKAKLRKLEFSDVGETLCTYASQSPEFHAALKRMVAAAITVASEPVRKRLSGRGWLS
jgi:hypothetical protein